MGRLETVAPPEASPEAGPEPPQVFVRTFTTPVGLPWDQARAAQLEARHGAPLPIAELAHQLRRLEGWSYARPGRFAVFYVRRRDFKQPFETTLDVDGAAVRVAFGRRRRLAAGQMDQLRGAAVVGAGLALAAVVVTAACVQASNVRAEAEARLERLEREAAAKLRLANRLGADREIRRALAAAQGASGTPEQVLRDLAWVTRARTPEARIVAVHWEQGLLAIEARGKAPPVSAIDREIVRSDKPLPSGLWLWGVGPIGAGEGPVVSDLAEP
jgi:hypothetical protein